MENKKQKVGIVTLPGNFNYGNRLQNYAVTQVYESRGFKAESLVLADRPNALRDLKQLVRKLLRKPVSHPEDNMSEERLEAFQRFNKNMCIGVVNFDEFNPKEYTFFSVGSDQVWNLGYIKYNEDWFFLDFAKKEQRVALAPSIGLDALDERQRQTLGKGRSEFPFYCLSGKNEVPNSYMKRPVCGRRLFATPRLSSLQRSGMLFRVIL